MWVAQQPESIAPEQVAPLLDHPAWWMQEKMDGKHLQVYHFDGNFSVANKKGEPAHNVPPQLKQVLVPARAGTHWFNFALNGEWIAKQGVFWMFDLLHWHVHDLRHYSYQQRYGLMSQVFAGVTQIVPTYTTPEAKRHAYTRYQSEGYEGVVFKLASAPWSEGKGPNWKKCKFKKQLSAVVLEHNVQRSVEVGVCAGGGLIRIGGCSIPGKYPLPPIGSVIEIEYIYAFPTSNQLVCPVFLRVRDDVSPTECGLDQLVYKREADG